jgi:hypothetical protein
MYQIRGLPVSQTFSFQKLKRILTFKNLKVSKSANIFSRNFHTKNTGGFRIYSTTPYRTVP